MNYLGRFLQFFKAIFQRDKIPFPSSTIDSKESVSRFIFESNKIKKDSHRVSPQAFCPPQSKKLSIYRTTNCNDNEIWALSDEFVTPLRRDKKKAKGRGDVVVETILKAKLKIVPYPYPHPRHANVIEWPDEEAYCLMVQTELANNARLVIRS